MSLWFRQPNDVKLWLHVVRRQQNLHLSVPTRLLQHLQFARQPHLKCRDLE